MNETEIRPSPVAATASQESLREAKPTDAVPEKEELPPHLRPDPTLTFMARNVSW